MTFGREKRQMLAWLAIVAPLPLPFSKTLEWPVLFVYTLFLVYFLQRVERGDPTVLPNWVLNLLGLAYLPILVVDLQASFLRSRAVAALLHLIMFLIVVKLFSMRRERDKWQLMMAAFFLFLGAMATSTHLTVGVYLLAYMTLSLLVLGRFAHLHMLGSVQRTRPRPGAGKDARARRAEPAVPYRVPLAAGVALIVALAIPTFATMPRLREPFIMGPGGGSGLIRTTGFSDSVDLSLTSAIRGNREVVLRVKYGDASRRSGGEIRFKGATYDRYKGNRWYRLLRHSSVLSPQMDEKGRSFRLFAERPAGRLEMFRERMSSTSLLLPMEAVAVKIDKPSLGVDLGGAVYLPGMPMDTIRYEVEIASGPRFLAQLARLDSNEVSPFTALDQGGVTDRMRQLAREVMGEGTAEERIARLERFLLTEYSYTVDFVGRDGEKALEDFLFVYKSGHCEYFASSMVLLLRAEGIPARLATGFMGAEYNPLEGYFMVRQDNAHAWVEAFTPEGGWRVWDPTPPEGRPSVPASSLVTLMNQLYDYLTFRWDRYVLTFGAEDQRDFFDKARQRLAGIWAALTGWATRDAAELPTVPAGGVEASEDDVIREPQLWLSRIPLTLAVVLFLAGVAALVAWHRRAPFDAGAAYRRLRHRLERAGLAVTESLAPLALEELAAARFPDAERPTRRLVRLYLRESFAGHTLDADERADLKEHLKAVGEAIRRRDRQRKLERRRGGQGTL